MKLLLSSIAIVCLAGCDTAPAPTPVEDDGKILAQHACLDGTWMASTVDITINNQLYRTSASPAFLIFNGQASASIQQSQNNKYYSGSGIRAWSTKNDKTLDIYSSAWSAVFDRNANDTNGVITMPEACSIQYAGDVSSNGLPQCNANAKKSMDLRVVLDCSSEDETLSIVSESTYIRYKKVHENSEVVDFPVTELPSVPPADNSDVPILNDEEIIEILNEEYPDLPDGTLDDIIDDITELDLLPLGTDEAPVEEEPVITPQDPKDKDSDNDGVPDYLDAFPLDPTETEDYDQDNIGNNADPDDDNDGVSDTLDAFPFDKSESVDTDGDNIGNNFDSDDDGDLVNDSRDAFPLDPTEWVDTDGDGIGNNKDDNDDNDPALDIFDAFPLDPSEWLDTDNDGIGNNSDADIDGDHYTNTLDAFPLDGSEWNDTDNDGIGDNSDSDIDNDDYVNNSDAFPFDPTEWADTDGDGIGDNSDPDIDGDGLANDVDPEPYIANTANDIDSAEGFATQTFSDFYNGDNFVYTHYGFTQTPANSDYVSENQVRFKVSWQEDGLALLAKLLGYDPIDMDSDLADLLCPAQHKLAKASVFSLGGNENMLGMMEGNLSTCGLDDTSPLTIHLQTMIPTVSGNRYQVVLLYAIQANNTEEAKSLTVKFGDSTNVYQSNTQGFESISLEILADATFTPLSIASNGSSAKHILIDNIAVSDLGQSNDFDTCYSLFSASSEGFTKCMNDEISISQGCTFDMSYSGNSTVTGERSNFDNLFTQEPANTGVVNFLSLGLKGKIDGHCKVAGYDAHFLIQDKRFTLNEISWNDETYESYPEEAQISIHLSECDNRNQNGNSHIAVIKTGESYSYDFTQDDSGSSYEGCRVDTVTIQDKTSKSSASEDGADLNSFHFSDL